MPKKPIDYSKCCIYKIEHIENHNLLYVGHTTEFNKRKGHHKSTCKNENSNVYNIKLYQMIRNNRGWDMFKMIEVEKFICNDRREAE
jgi:predicted GIY-YIG superfamily endonuclease